MTIDYKISHVPESLENALVSSKAVRDLFGLGQEFVETTRIFSSYGKIKKAPLGAVVTEIEKLGILNPENLEELLTRAQIPKHLGVPGNYKVPKELEPAFIRLGDVGRTLGFSSKKKAKFSKAVGFSGHPNARYAPLVDVVGELIGMNVLTPEKFQELLNHAEISSTQPYEYPIPKKRSTYSPENIPLELVLLGQQTNGSLNSKDSTIYEEIQPTSKEYPIPEQLKGVYLLSKQVRDVFEYLQQNKREELMKNPKIFSGNNGEISLEGTIKEAKKKGWLTPERLHELLIYAAKNYSSTSEGIFYYSHATARIFAGQISRGEIPLGALIVHENINKVGTLVDIKNSDPNTIRPYHIRLSCGEETIELVVNKPGFI